MKKQLLVILCSFMISGSVLAEWSILKSWNNTGAKTTEKFTTKSNSWRIVWKSQNPSIENTGILQISVYNKKGRMIALAANHMGIGQDVSYVHKAGTFYLMINSWGLDWEVRVETEK